MSLLHCSYCILQITYPILTKLVLVKMTGSESVYYELQMYNAWKLTGTQRGHCLRVPKVLSKKGSLVASALCFRVDFGGKSNGVFQVYFWLQIKSFFFSFFSRYPKLRIFRAFSVSEFQAQQKIHVRTQE